MARQGYYRIRSWWYWGRSRYCPCCESHFRRFLTFKYSQRPEAVCPRCGSLERHRLLWLYLSKKTTLLTQSLRLLHFAPEEILARRFRHQPNLHYLSADLLSPLADLRLSLSQIPLKDHTCDLILCSHVLIYVYDDEAALKDFYRVLTSNGCAIILEPVKAALQQTQEYPEVVEQLQRRTIYAARKPARFYGLDFLQRLQGAGFTVQVEAYASSLEPEERLRFGLKEDDKIYFCRKPGASAA